MFAVGWELNYLILYLSYIVTVLQINNAINLALKLFCFRQNALQSIGQNEHVVIYKILPSSGKVM